MPTLRVEARHGKLPRTRGAVGAAVIIAAAVVVVVEDAALRQRAHLVQGWEALLAAVDQHPYGGHQHHDKAGVRHDLQLR